MTHPSNRRPGAAWLLAAILLWFAGLILVPSARAAIPNAIGQRVKTNTSTTVRMTAAGTSAGPQQVSGSPGTTTAGPVTASLSGTSYVWWKVNFDLGTDGWVINTTLDQMIVTPPALTVTSPNGGEFWSVGSVQTITWTITGTTGTIDVQQVAYSTNGGSTYTDLNVQLPGSARSYNWTIPAGLNSGQARMRVRAWDEDGAILTSDASNGNFSIQSAVIPPAVTVMTPDGGEIWPAGSQQTVTWGITGNTAEISSQQLAYSTDGGSSYTNITTTLLPSARSYNWTLPASANTAQARVRVRVLDDGSNIIAADASNGNFTIQGAVVPPSATVTSPNGGEIWTAGTQQTVTWTISGGVSAITSQQLAYSTDGGSSYTNISTVIAAGTRSFNWTLPAGAATAQARVRVRALDGGAAILTSDASNSNFTINPPPVAPQITQPPAKQAVREGKNAQFTVTATGANLTYLWMKEGVPLTNGGRISGASTSTLTITGAQAADGGSYSVTVALGDFPDLKATSDSALLTVVPAGEPPWRGPVTPLIIDAQGGRYLGIRFVRFTGALGTEIRVQRSADMQQWTDATTAMVPAGSPVSNPDGITETVTLRAPFSLSEAAAQDYRFLRLVQVTAAP